MNCSGCGKDIPFLGEVCPFCQRDKSADKKYSLWCYVCCPIGGWLGYMIIGGWGILIGLFAGCIAAVYLSGAPKKSTPPEVSIAPPASLESRLRHLKDLHQKGLLTEEDYQIRKSDILKEV